MDGNINQGVNWWIYLIRTPQNALYCGVTTDVERRFNQHQTGKGAKALRGRFPLQLVWFQPVGTRRDALRLEQRIKQLPKRQKEEIVSKNLSLSHILLF
jgi:putative endonuclease